MMRLQGIRRSAGVSDLDEARDLHLMKQIALGDEDSFVELFETCGPPAFSLALRIAGDRDLAEEVLQEVFLGIWRKAATFDGARGSVRTWLLTHIHHRAVDVVRREKAERRRTTTSFPQAAAAPSEEDVIEEHWLAARRTRVRRALAGLPDEQRVVIELCYFDGLTQTQAAAQLDVPLGTVKSRTLSAMKRLRRSLHGGDQS